MTTSTVRRATAGDAGTISGALASAFGEDPLFCWMSGQDDCERRMGPFWRTIVRSQLRKNGHDVYVSSDGASAAVWRGVDDWKATTGEIVRSLPGMLTSLRWRLPKTLGLLAAMEKAHPTEPHYYLECLGTQRSLQGKGGGSAVMSVMLERCDAEGMPAYLESSNPRNIPFYARHGFVETGVIAVPGADVTLTPMWREPRG